MLRKVLFHVDRALGEGLEAAVCMHHRRRLANLGWSRALDPPDDGRWATGPPPPRSGNAIEVLIDGEATFTAVVEAVRAARSHVYFAGWFLNPDFNLLRDGSPATVRAVFEDAARRIPVRVLMWGGAPVPWLTQTSRSGARSRAEELCRGTRIQYAADTKERPLHCHHEKTIVVDDEIAFVNGIEPTLSGGDRFDGQHHTMRGERGWHDVATRLRGPIVADVAEHFRMRWHEVTGEDLAPAELPVQAGSLTAQIVRTVPEHIYKALPRGDFSMLEAYVRALRSAQRFIYLENQFLWSPHIVQVLADKLRSPPSDDFRLVVLLPSRPTTGMDDTLGQLGVLVEADSGHRFLACTLYAHSGSRIEQVYVHAKVGIVDDEWLTIGSANLNNHSLFNDTEMNVVACDRDLAESTRHRLWAEHLELPIEQVRGDPTGVIDELWRPIAVDQLRLRDAGKPITHRLVELPKVSKRSKRLIGPLQSLFVDG
jgi:phosphatidylserine/phosphatidylglycerophosphate/cardiolipin synthase-like enzyme